MRRKPMTPSGSPVHRVHSQLVVMTLQPGEEIGLERHDTVDQFTPSRLGYDRPLSTASVTIK